MLNKILIILRNCQFLNKIFFTLTLFISMHYGFTQVESMISYDIIDST